MISDKPWAVREYDPARPCVLYKLENLDPADPDRFLYILALQAPTPGSACARISVLSSCAYFHFCALENPLYFQLAFNSLSPIAGKNYTVVRYWKRSDFPGDSSWRTLLTREVLDAVATNKTLADKRQAKIARRARRRADARVRACERAQNAAIKLDAEDDLRDWLVRQLYDEIFPLYDADDFAGGDKKLSTLLRQANQDGGRRSWPIVDWAASLAHDYRTEKADLLFWWIMARLALAVSWLEFAPGVPDLLAQMKKKQKKLRQYVSKYHLQPRDMSRFSV